MPSSTQLALRSSLLTSPLALSSLALWLDASNAGSLSGAVNDGDLVASWVDQSRTGLTFAQGTAANKPALKTGLLNGRNVLRFNGTSDFLSVASGALLGSQPGGTILVAASRVADAALHAYMDLGGTGNAGLVFYSCSTTTSPELFQYGSGSSIISLTYNSSPTTYHYSTARWGSGGGDFRVNGVQRATSATASGLSFQATLYLGCVGGTVRFHSGDIAEVLFYSRTLSDYEVQRVESYLKRKWGL